MTYTYGVYEPSAYTDDEIAEGVAFSNAFQREILPDDPPTPVAEAIAAHRTVPPRVRRWSVRARDEHGAMAGSTGGRVDPEHDDNPDIAWASPVVLAEHRRRGIGTQLLAHLVAHAQADGRTRLIGNTFDRAPCGNDFARAIGAEEKQAMHLNHLMVSDVDRAMLEQWVADGPVRAEDYELISWSGAVPEEHLQSFIDIVLVMNTAPRDDLEMNDFTLTPREVREQEEQMAAIGAEHWVLVARRRSDGAWAGFHDMTWVPFEPNVMNVGATGVRPEHRGHALGKWLKAAMMLRILDEKPDVNEVRTGNADSNDAMLGINKQMGYKPMIAALTWEISVEKAAAWLAERGVALPAV